jgi:hypothetical protein
MKKTRRDRTTKSRQKASKLAAGKPGRPTRKRLKHIAEDVMTQERRDRRSTAMPNGPRGRPENRTPRSSGPSGIRGHCALRVTP